MDGEQQLSGPCDRQSQNILRSHLARTLGDMFPVESLSRSLIVVKDRFDNELAFLDTGSQVILESCLARTSRRRTTSPSRSLPSYLVGGCGRHLDHGHYEAIVNMYTGNNQHKDGIHTSKVAMYAPNWTFGLSGRYGGFLKSRDRMRALPR